MSSPCDGELTDGAVAMGTQLLIQCIWGNLWIVSSSQGSSIRKFTKCVILLNTWVDSQIGKKGERGRAPSWRFAFSQLPRIPYNTFYGCACLMTGWQMEKVNGWSNKYFGWGGEDDNMWRRIEAEKMKVWRVSDHLATYATLKHQQATMNSQRYVHFFFFFFTPTWICLGLKEVRVDDYLFSFPRDIIRNTWWCFAFTLNARSVPIAGVGWCRRVARQSSLEYKINRFEKSYLRMTPNNGKCGLVGLQDFF